MNADVIPLKPPNPTLQLNQMLGPFSAYSRSFKSVVICLVSIVFLFVGAIAGMVGDGSFSAGSPTSIINALIFPYVVLAFWSGSDPNVERRQSHVTFVSLAFSGFLILMSASIYLFGFPAARKLAIMPLLTVMLFLPFFLWRSWGRKAAKTQG